MGINIATEVLIVDLMKTETGALVYVPPIVML